MEEDWEEAFFFAVKDLVDQPLRTFVFSHGSRAERDAIPGVGMVQGPAVIPIQALDILVLILKLADDSAEVSVVGFPPYYRDQEWPDVVKELSQAEDAGSAATQLSGSVFQVSEDD
jgi:hypothetical protein